MIELMAIIDTNVILEYILLGIAIALIALRIVLGSKRFILLIILDIFIILSVIVGSIFYLFKIYKNSNIHILGLKKTST